MKNSIASAWLGTLVLVVLTAPLGAQQIPTISARQFSGGTAKLVVTGSFSINADLPLHTQASFGSGEKTWIQFGNSGLKEPNALLTYGEEVGVTIGLGKLMATAGITPGERPQCSGKTEVTANLVSGRYTCPGASSYDPATGKMGKVDIDITFTAKTQ